jgi:hypothetical protein|tara:strand:+ start:145 stop:369 length:225 start_codon:yes stop_codon:yes gene_type:complete
VGLRRTVTQNACCQNHTFAPSILTPASVCGRIAAGLAAISIIGELAGRNTRNIMALTNSFEKFLFTTIGDGTYL